MRKFLIGLTVLATGLTGGVLAASGANAAPRFTAPVMVASEARVQPVQYYEDGRYREWRQREELERFRRHEDWRRERHEAHERREARERHEAREHEEHRW